MRTPHSHGLKRVADGYVLDRLAITDEVLSELFVLLQSDRADYRQFAARNLHDVSPARAAPPLLDALGCETDAFIAGLIISALGTMRLPAAVPAIERWAMRADEAFIAQNIMESYLQLLMESGCGTPSQKVMCETIGETLHKFSTSDDPIVAQEARRILDLFAL